MTTTENDFFTISLNSRYTPIDLKAPFDPDPINEDVAIPYYFTKPYNKMDSFIVDWQMSTDEN